MQQILATADKLSEVIQNMQKCLQCTICLHTISNPVRTRCGHRFCRFCIETVMKNKNAFCPLCKTVIQRRSICRDEHIEMYNDRLEKLKQAIQKDSGIDLSLHVPRQRSIRESCSSENTDQPRSEENYIQPSCSYAEPKPLKKPSVSKSNRSTQKPKRSRNSKAKKDNSVCSSGIKQYLTKYALSGCEPLPPDEHYHPEDNSTEFKIQSWLETLPTNKQFDGLNRIESTACNLDNTIPYSVSQGAENEVDTAAHEPSYPVTSKDGNYSHDVIPRRPSKDQELSDTLRKTIKAENPPGSSATPYSRSIDITHEPRQTDRRASTSTKTSSFVEIPQEQARNQERTSDVHRTSPCDLLPSMKQNWTSVVQFGKEMRTKRRKKKSLNVSIENKNKKLMNASSRQEASKKRGQPKRETRKSIEDTRIAENDCNERLPTCEDAEEQGPRNKKNRSMLESQSAKESSFIMLEKGEQVHIRNLNSHQMNDIIGVVPGNQAELGIENPPGNRDNENEFMQELDLCRTPMRDQLSRSPIDATPYREAERIKVNELCSTSNFQSSTPLPNRLSLKRRDVLSNDPQSSDSQMMSVRRDLNREIIRNEEGGTDKVMGKLTSGAKNKPEEGCRNNLAGPSLKDRKQEGEKEGKLVMFQKLGRVFKPRRRPVIFRYLGSTRRRFQDRQDYVKGLQCPCNSVELESPQNLCPEDNFGNNTEITLNDAKETQNVEESSSKRNESDTNTRRISALEERPLNTDQSGASVNREVQRETFNVDKTTTSKPSNKGNDAAFRGIVPTTAASQLRDSSDILFVSLYESQEKDSVPLHRPEQLAFKSGVKMLSPKKDTQLKPFFSDSPTTSTVEATRLAQQDEDIGAKKSNLSNVRDVHSRDLIRTSLQGSEESETDSWLCKKRKRSASRDNSGQTMKRMTKERDQSKKDSRDGSIQSLHRGNLIKDLATDRTDNIDKKYYTLSSSRDTRYTETVAVSSNTDTETKDHSPKDQKRRFYKRITHKVANSDVACLESESDIRVNDEVGLSPNSKRKRAGSPDSVSDNDLNMIVNDWSKDLKPTDRFSKKGKVETSSSSTRMSDKNIDLSLKSSTSNSSRIPNNTIGWRRRRLFQLDVESNSEKSTSVKKELLVNKAALEDDSPDFGEIIDRIRGIQNAAIAFNEDPRQRGTEDCLMQDNFDDIIANVDTESLVYDFGGPSRKESEIMENTRKGQNGGRFLLTNEERLYNGLDKENRYKESGKLYDTESDDEKTLEPVYVQATDKSSREGSDRSISRRENVAVGKSFSAQLVIPDNDKMTSNAINDSPPKDSSDQDSLMNITEHQLLIKQFEDDLFGRTENVNAQTIGVQLTSPSSSNANRSSKMQREDAEHSPDEDDIVENTPNVKTKNLQAINSTLQENSMASPVSHITEDRASKTPSSVTERSSTIGSCLSNKNIQPIYQSTPRDREQPENDCNSVFGTSTNKLKPAANAYMSLIRATNSAAGISGAGIDQQDPSRQKLRFVCSGLLPGQIDQVKKFATIANAEYQSQFDTSVTHVIVKEQENNSASKTLKYLQGVAYGKWVVGYQWVIDSLKERRVINAEKYEVVDCETFEAGPRNSRLRQKNLFEGFVFLCIGPFSGVSVEQYQELLRATGGVVVETEDVLAAVKSRLKIIVIQADEYDYEIIGWYKMTRGVPVAHDWVVECISRYKLISFYRYLQELSRQDVLALGYPEYLVEEDPEDVDLDTTCEDTT